MRLAFQAIMNDVELEQRPKKKRRFFVEDSPPAPQETPPAADADRVETGDTGLDTGLETSLDTQEIPESTFDVDVLSSFLGEQLSDPVVAILRNLSQNNLERGIPPMNRDHPR